MTYHLDLDLSLRPADAYARVRHLWVPVLLESTERGAGEAGGPGRPRWSFLAVEPRLLLETRGGRTRSRTGPDAPWRHEEGAPLDVLRRALATRADGAERSAAPHLPPFRGGAIGFFGYELGARLDPVPLAGLDDLGFPEMRFGVYDHVVVWDHVTGSLAVHGLTAGGAPGCGGEEGASAPARALAEMLGGAPPSRESRADSSRPVCTPAAPTHPVPDFPGVRSTFTREAYEAAVERVRAYIRAGDVFQVNLSHRLQVPFTEDPLALHERLATRNPAGFAGILEMEDGRTLVSASPERFLSVAGRQVESRPIKGTVPRGRDAAEDALLRGRLAASEKDRAENVMIVDLVRNDLSRVCADGSVRVPVLCALETLPTVTHLVSTVTGTLRPDADALSAVEAAFPGGSVTGAPKLRAMEIIAELEPTHRGPYTGSFGWIGFDGALDLDIGIRTVLVAGGQAHVQVGGAVVLDSEPAAEWRETLDKAEGLLAALLDTPSPRHAEPV